ncbi:unnamed protein product [Rhizophagus irregularis]|nr:unnamed protein product [Rhizophagus irregularis]
MEIETNRLFSGRLLDGRISKVPGLKERKKQKGKVRWLLGHTGVQYFEGLVVLVLERMEFNISKVFTGFYFSIGHLIHE